MPKQNRNIEALADTRETRFKLAMEEYNTFYSPRIFVTETLRSKEDQEYYVKMKKSQTMKSNHLTGHACDIAFEWPELYPSNEKIWANLCNVMRKYGIVNGYYDLKWWFDKPHFQPVEAQKPQYDNSNYSYAKIWISRLKTMMRARSTARHRTKNQSLKDRLHERNNIIREMFDKIWVTY